MQFKTLTPKQMLQRLPIALAQVKAGNTSENLLNQIRQIIYSLFRAKEITKKVYNNIMNSENSKTSDCQRLLLNLSDKINLKRSDKYVALSNLSIYYSWKNMKAYKKNKFKVSAPTWNKDFELPGESYSVSDIQDYFEYIFKKHESATDNPSIKIYVNKMENRIMFKARTEYYHELLTPETVKLPGSTKSKTTKDENGEKISRLEIAEIVLIHCNIVNNDCQQDSRVLYTFVPNKSFGQL